MGSPTLSYKWISIFFPALLLGYFALTSSLDAQGSTEILTSSLDAQGSTEIECDRQTFSPVDCPQLSVEETDTDGDEDDTGNIEEQIPSVIPFP